MCGKGAATVAVEEQVLVMERKIVEEVGIFNGLAFNVDDYLSRIFVQGVGQFMARSQAETDPNYKQIIPYVIMSCEGKYLSYVRGKRAGENRLTGLRSIGIGGHINPIDDMPLFSNDFYDTYLTAVKREVEEEVMVEANYKDRIVALLNDESNEVGSVHIGIVHYWVLDEPKVNKREQMITQMVFLTPDELMDVKDTMETWSALCVDGLEEMTRSIEDAALKDQGNLKGREL